MGGVAFIQALLARVLGLKGFRARIAGLVGLSGRSDDVCGDDDATCRRELASVWQSIQDSAERWYDRSADCAFTTFHAWEYSHSPQATKVHRNIILRNEIVPELPISSLETTTAMELRQQLAKYTKAPTAAAAAAAATERLHPESLGRGAQGLHPHRRLRQRFGGRDLPRHPRVAWVGAGRKARLALPGQRRRRRNYSRRYGVIDV